MGDVSFQLKGPIFRGQPNENLAQVMTTVTIGEGTKSNVITSGVSSAQYGEVAAFVFVSLSYFRHHFHIPDRGADWTVDGSNDAILCEEMPFGISLLRNFIWGFEIPKNP
jgi:hypothetical protein